MPDCSCCEKFDSKPLATILPCGNRYRPPTANPLAGKGYQQLTIREILNRINPEAWTVAAQRKMLEARAEKTKQAIEKNPIPPKQDIDIPAVFSAQFPYFLGLMAQLSLAEQVKYLSEVQKILVKKQTLDVPAFSVSFLGPFWDGTQCKAEGVGDWALDPANYAGTHGQKLAQELDALVKSDARTAKIFQFLSPDFKYTWSEKDMCRFVHLVKSNEVLEAYDEGFKSGLLQPGAHAQIAIFAAGEKLGQMVSAGYYRQDQRVMVQEEIAAISKGLADLGKKNIVCHSCGAGDPGEDTMNRLKHKWRYDHQPPSSYLGDRAHPELTEFVKVNHKFILPKKLSDGQQRIYPQCFQCERDQSVLVAEVMRWHETLTDIKGDCGFTWDKKQKQWTGPKNASAVSKLEKELQKKYSKNPNLWAIIRQFLQSDFEIMPFISGTAMNGKWLEVERLSLRAGAKFNEKDINQGREDWIDKDQIAEAADDLPEVKRVGAYPPPTSREFENIGNVGAELCCHTCGTRDPLRGLQWIADHQPPTGLAAVNLMETPQLLLPHCLACSTRQSTLMRTIVEHFNECYEIKAPPPEITEIDPESKLRKEGDFTLVITGKRFKKTSKVLWNGVVKASAFRKSTRITVDVKQADLDPPGPITITVQNKDGQESNPVTFDVKPQCPTLSLLSPDQTEEGSDDGTLKLTGTEYFPGALVMWDATPLTPTIASETEMTVTVPADLVKTRGTVTILVKGADGQVSGTRQFTITPRPPRIASLNPTTATAGDPDLTLRIQGSGFQPNSIIVFDGHQLGDSHASDASNITGTIPANLLTNARTVNVTVSNPNDATVSGGSQFTILHPAPVLNSLSQYTAVVGSPDLDLTLNGQHFRGSATVHIGLQQLNPHAGNANSLTIRVPANMLNGLITYSPYVRHTDDGLFSGSLQFQVVAPAPDITNGLNPSSALAGEPPFILTVTGQHLQPNAVVRWNNVAQPTIAGPFGGLQIQVPANFIANPGFANVDVVNPDGQVSGIEQFEIRQRKEKRTISIIEEGRTKPKDRDRIKHQKTTHPGEEEEDQDEVLNDGEAH